MHTNQGHYNGVQLYLIQSLLLLNDINKVFVYVITAHIVTVNFRTSYNETTIHCSLMYQFLTIIIHFFWSQKLPISVTHNYTECLISQTAISPHKLFLILSHGSQYSQNDHISDVGESSITFLGSRVAHISVTVFINCNSNKSQGRPNTCVPLHKVMHTTHQKLFTVVTDLNETQILWNKATLF